MQPPANWLLNQQNIARTKRAPCRQCQRSHSSMACAIPECQHARICCVGKTQRGMPGNQIGGEAGGKPGYRQRTGAVVAERRIVNAACALRESHIFCHLPTLPDCIKPD